MISTYKTNSSRQQRMLRQNYLELVNKNKSKNTVTVKPTKQKSEK